MEKVFVVFKKPFLDDESVSIVKAFKVRQAALNFVEEMQEKEYLKSGSKYCTDTYDYEEVELQ